MLGSQALGKVIQAAYSRLFAWLVRPRLLAGDADAGAMHVHIISVLGTGVLMWTYALVALFSMNSWVPGVVGVAAALVHNAMLFAFRFTARIALAASVFLFAGMVHQLTFAWYSGGFLSSITVWIAVLPLFAGIVAGKQSVIVWAGLTLVAGATMMLLQLTFFPAPNDLSRTGQWIAQACLVFGWIAYSTISVLNMLWLWEQRRQKIDEQKAHAEMLFRGLFHDLVSPLNALEYAVRDLAQEGLCKQETLAVIRSSLGHMRAVTGGARTMHAAEQGRLPVARRTVSLPAVLERVPKLFHAEAKKRGVILSIDLGSQLSIDVVGDHTALVHHVFGNLVSNAIRHSPIGGVVTLAVTVEEESVFVEVRDEGPGLESPGEVDLKEAASPLVQGEHIGGFGLQIARSFLRRFDARLHFRHDDAIEVGGSGCRVVVELLRAGHQRDDIGSTEKLVRRHLRDDSGSGSGTRASFRRKQED